MKIKTYFQLVGICSVYLFGSSSIGQENEEDSALEEIVVTGSYIAVERGGVQDVNYLREKVDDGKIPLPDDFSIEGLLGEYAIEIPITKSCHQLLCLVGESVQTKLITQRHSGVLTAISFSSNAKAEDFSDQSLNIVAVVDRSGSMGGQAIELVKTALSSMVEQLNENDQLSIVSYSSVAQTLLPPTKVHPENRDLIDKTIKAIKTDGGTNLEAGLNLGYQIAEENINRTIDQSRLMLFTDERPNIGNTGKDGFIEQAIAYSKKGVGLTTIGVGDHFGIELASQVGSVRGGNMHFIRDQADALRLFGEELISMVSPLAYDLDLLIKPMDGFRISGVYGVPTEFLSFKSKNEINLHLPTVFAGNKQGAVFVSMQAITDDHLPKNIKGTPQVQLSLRYQNPNKSRRSHNTLTLEPNNQDLPSTGMQLGSLLINEYLVIKSAAKAQHWENDQTKAYWLIRSLYHEFVNKGLLVPSPEQELVSRLYTTVAKAAGYDREVWGE